MKNVILATLGMGLLAMGSINTASALDLGAGFTVADSCVFAPPHTISSTTSNLSAVLLDLTVVDPMSVASGTFSYSNTSCNYPATFSLQTANGRIEAGNPGDAPAGFENGIDYVASVDYCPTTVEGTPLQLTADSSASDGDMESRTCTTAYNGTFELQIDTAAAAGPLVSGTYVDTLTVHLGSLF